MQFIDLRAQYSALKKRIDQRIQTVLDHGQYIMGPEVRELEEQLAAFTGVKHVISCANGTDALQLALMALNLKSGDAVFCPDFTFYASSEAISFVGATPVFVDVDKDTFNLCPDDLEAKIKNVQTEGHLSIKAIMAVDLFGLPADYPRIKKVAKKYDLKIIEDAAQGFGGSIYGERACSFADVATTSFFPAKPLGCYGDGGALFTDDDMIAEVLCSLRVHGKGTDKYDNVRVGMNSRLDTIQAAILLEKLAVFPSELLQRQLLADHYTDCLAGCADIPIVPDGFNSSWAQYTLKLDGRNEKANSLREEGVPTAVYYARTMSQQTANLNVTQYGELHNSEQLASVVLSLPMHPYMTDDQKNKITDSLAKIFD